MKKKEVFILISIILCFIINSFCTFALECNNVRKSSLRLHILANSNSNEDQELKLRIRDRIINESTEIFKNNNSLNQAKLSVNNNIELIKNIAKDEIEKSGFNYSVNCQIVNMFFNTRVYDNFTMPAGYYDALRVEIGEANGDNWWCVMFPPMCLPAAKSSDEDINKVNEYKEEHKVINEKPKYEIKFAILEFLENLIK